MYSRLRAQHTKGFTLVELLVSVSLFVIVMMVSVGSLLSLVDANRKAQSLKSVTNNLNFALDTMTRTLRTGYDFSCGSTGSPHDCSTGATSITFLDDRGCSVTYAFTGGSLKRSVANGTNSSCPISTNQALTAPEVTVDDMRFYVTGTGYTPGNTEQPTVTLVVRGYMGTTAKTRSLFNIQTTVTQRLLDL